MGRSRRQQPARLAEKLLLIRQRLNLSQSQMFRSVAADASSGSPQRISDYESGKREPPLAVLLGYARAASVPVELLIDDGYDLPTHLPADNIEWVVTRGRVWRRRKRVAAT